MLIRSIHTVNVNFIFAWHSMPSICTPNIYLKRCGTMLTVQIPFSLPKMNPKTEFRENGRNSFLERRETNYTAYVDVVSAENRTDIMNDLQRRKYIEFHLLGPPLFRGIFHSFSRVQDISSSMYA